ncbi:MAG: 5-oxoprolinase subunit PxpA [Pseudomonadota bacterium]
MTTRKTDLIDLNADLGESFGPWTMGNDADMLSVVTSANVACGGHASDPETMYRTLTSAKQSGVIVGAHPGYADREGFGRRVIPMKPDEIARMVASQIGALQAVAKLAGTDVHYVKPHGALANLAARDHDVAQAIAQAIKSVGPHLSILAISGTALEVEAGAANIDVYSEIFADRGYQPNGQLVPRDQPGAMIHDPHQAAARIIGMLETGLMPTIGGDPIALKAHSICVHGDGPAALAMAKSVRSELEGAGIRLKPFIAPS